MSQNLSLFTLNRDVNPNAQFSVGNAVAFADAAGTAPVDGTGGAPTVTITRTESTPLDGSASFLFTKDAANRQGEGWSFDRVLQPSDATKVFNLQFDYQITTGTYTGYQAPASFSDLTAWFYDVTNAVMYQMQGFQLDGAVSTTNQYSYSGSIQIPVGCLTGRVIFFLGNTGTSAFTARFNNISFGRVPRVQGSIMTPGATYTPTFGAMGTVTLPSVTWDREGSKFNAVAAWTTGTPGGSLATFSLPPGIIPDSAFYGTTYNYIVGKWSEGTSASVFGNVLVSGLTLSSGGNGVVFFARDNTAGVATTPNNGNSIMNASAKQECFFSLHVQGWGANGTLGQDADTRVLACRYSVGATTFTNSSVAINYGTRAYDTFGGVTTGNGFWRMTSPASGVWDVTVCFTGATGGPNIALYKNGVLDSYMINLTGTALNPQSGACQTYLNAGDYIDARVTVAATFTISDFGTTNYFCAARRSGPAQVQAPEVITARYSTNAGQSITNNSVTIVDYEDKSYDDHGIVTTGASWKVTAPRAGKVRVNAKASFASNAGWAVGETAYLAIFKNAAEYARGPFDSPVTATIVVNLSVEDEVDVLAGDTIDIRIFQLSGGTIALDTTSVKNFVSINYVGGITQ